MCNFLATCIMLTHDHADNSSTFLYHVETLAIFIFLVLSTQCGRLGRLDGEIRVQEVWNKPS